MMASATVSSRSQRTEQYEQERLDHTPWVEKYRPKNLDDVASQDYTVKVLKKSLESANLPHMLFYGPPGTGKTSTILALARQLYGPRLYKTRVLELNASDERGISIVREKIKKFASLVVSTPSREDLADYPCPPYKIIILDEADSMTKDAQSALRRTIENYAGVTRFCLICNYITRIIDPLSSRCSKFRFGLLNNDNALSRLDYIVKNEGLQLEPGVPEELFNISKGDLRKAITILQSAAKLHLSPRKSGESGEEDIDMIDNDELSQAVEKITKLSIQEIAGVVPASLLDSVVTALESSNTKRILQVIEEVILQGWSAQQVIDQLHDRYILNDSLSSLKKNKISWALHESDKKLNNGGDEHVQLLSLSLQIAKIV